MTEPARKRRWPKILAAFAVLLLIGAWWVNRQLEPDRLTALVLSQAGESLGLELTIEGTPDYALRPEPRLVLPKLSARQPGAATPLLHAERAEVSLPWDTLLGGGSLVITRLELERPVLDLAALAAWQATRPAAPFELPTFTAGLQVVDGTVLGEGWAVDMLGLDLPELRPGEPAAAKLSGLFERQTTFVMFEGELRVAKAGLASALEAELEGRVRDGELDVPYQLDWTGDFDMSGDDVLLGFRTLSLSSEPPVPSLTAQGTARFGDITELKFDGELPGWPADWPALPPPLAESTAPLAFGLVYAGPDDFDAPLGLTLVREQTRLESQLVLPEVLAWMDSESAGLLPPLVGTLETPSLVVAGATLEGVKISIEEDAPEEPATEEEP